jgi:hypothetical protein
VESITLWSLETIFLLQCPVNLTFEFFLPKFNREHFLPSVVYMCDMVTLSGKDNGLEPGNCISTSMSGAFDPKINREHLSMVVYMCDTGSLKWNA